MHAESSCVLYIVYLGDMKNNIEALGLIVGIKLYEFEAAAAAAARLKIGHVASEAQVHSCTVRFIGGGAQVEAWGYGFSVYFY